MVLEVAILKINPNQETEFEKNFVLASRFIASIKGYTKHFLKKCVETPGKYILLVEWESLESHEVGFRQSPQYLEWKNLLHHYYDPFPIVEHYVSVFENRI